MREIVHIISLKEESTVYKQRNTSVPRKHQAEVMAIGVGSTWKFRSVSAGLQFKAKTYIKWSIALTLLVRRLTLDIRI